MTGAAGSCAIDDMTLILSPTAAAPANPTAGYTQNGSGLYVPSLQTPASGDFVVAKPDDIDRIPELLGTYRDELANTWGAPAADALVGASPEIADSARRQIEHDRIVAAFMNGDLAGAVDAASRH